MIIDASIALRWIVPERRSTDSDDLLRLGGLKAPSLLIAEIGHALAKRVRRKLASPEQARTAWEDLHAAPLEIIDAARHNEIAFNLALRLNATFYDCLYLALAIAEDEPLATGDARFANAAANNADLAGRIRLLNGD